MTLTPEQLKSVGLNAPTQTQPGVANSDQEMQAARQSYQSAQIQKPQEEGFAEKVAGVIPGLKTTAKAIGSAIGLPFLTSQANKASAKVNDLVTESHNLPAGDPRKKELLQKAKEMGQRTSDELKGALDEAPTVKEAAGGIGNLALSAATLGTGGLAGEVPGLVGVGARALEMGATGAGLKAASNLEEDKPIGEGVGVTSAISAAIPVVGKATSMIGSKVMDFASEGAPARIINSLIKPLGKDFLYGKNPGQAIAEAGITAKNLEELGQKVQQEREAVGTAISTTGRYLGKNAGKMDLSATLSPLDDALENAARNNDSGVFKRLQEVKKALSEKLGVSQESAGPIISSQGSKNLSAANFDDALKLKQQIGELTRWTGNMAEDKPVNSALKKAYGAVKESMNGVADKASPELGAAMRKLNEQYGSLTSAGNAIRYRDIVNQRQNLTPIITKMGAVGGVIASVLSGNIVPAAAGLAGMAAEAGMSSAAFKTRLAAGLAKLAPEEKEALTRAAPFLNRIFGPKE